MRTLILVLLGCLALVGPAIAMSTDASPANSLSPACITLVGTHGGVPASGAGQFFVVYRDLANNPIANATVVIDFSGTPDLSICADQQDPDAVVDCAHKTVSKHTAADGSVNFTVLGASNGGNPVTLLQAGAIYANGNLIGRPTVAAFDLDGSSGVGANDLSVWLTDFGTGSPYGRSDYDCSGGIGANDLSFWLTAFGSGTMTESCASHCP